jgi:predicted dehydrogenase
MLTHPIYLVEYFLGSVKLENIHVSKIGPYPWMRSDELVATLSGGDRFGQFYASFNSPRQAIELNLYGEKAFLQMDLINGTVNVLPSRPVKKVDIATDSIKRAEQIVSSTLSNIGKVVTGTWLSGHNLYIKEYSEAVLSGGKAPVSIADGHRVIQILEKMISEIEKLETV